MFRFPSPFQSCAAFLESHKDLVEGVQALARRVQSDTQLASLIRRKFAIKCTTGYSLNALVDFPADQPIEMIKRLMIGSEGTLGFVSRATYNTVPEWPFKASAFVMFPDVKSACKVRHFSPSCSRRMVIYKEVICRETLTLQDLTSCHGQTDDLCSLTALITN